MKNALILIILIGSLAACKKQYTCSLHYQIVESELLFKGFDTTELATIEIYRYKAKSGFSELIGTQVFNPDLFYTNGDTVFRRERVGFGNLNSYYDYKIVVPSTGHEFLLTDIDAGSYGGTWTQDEPCNVKGTNMTCYKTLKINGVDSRFYFLRYPYSAAVLTKY